MAAYNTDNYTSDDEIIIENQISYEYQDEEIQMVEEAENWNMVPIGIEEYERIREQADDLDNMNWELGYRCRIYEQELRISKRSVLVRIKDRIRFWKYKATEMKKRTKLWIQRRCHYPIKETLSTQPSCRFRDTLEARYYPYNFQ